MTIVCATLSISWRDRHGRETGEKSEAAKSLNLTCASKTFSVSKPFLGAKEKSQFDKFASKRSVSVYRGFPSR